MFRCSTPPSNEPDLARNQAATTKLCIAFGGSPQQHGRYQLSHSDHMVRLRHERFYRWLIVSNEDYVLLADMLEKDENGKIMAAKPLCPLSFVTERYSKLTDKALAGLDVLKGPWFFDKRATRTISAAKLKWSLLAFLMYQGASPAPKDYEALKTELCSWPEDPAYIYPSRLPAKTDTRRLSLLWLGWWKGLGHFTPLLSSQRSGKRLVFVALHRESPYDVPTKLVFVVGFRTRSGLASVEELTSKNEKGFCPYLLVDDVREIQIRRYLTTVRAQVLPSSIGISTTASSPNSSKNQRSVMSDCKQHFKVSLTWNASDYPSSTKRATSRSMNKAISCERRWPCEGQRRLWQSGTTMTSSRHLLKPYHAMKSADSISYSCIAVRFFQILTLLSLPH